MMAVVVEDVACIMVGLGKPKIRTTASFPATGLCET